MSGGEHQLSLAGLADAAEPAGLAPSGGRSGPRPDRKPEPTAEQLAAVAARTRDAFLEAGAGTGKTTVLVDRYCAAVADNGVEVEQILAFTFTERAASSARTRIRISAAARSVNVKARICSTSTPSSATAAQ